MFRKFSTLLLTACLSFAPCLAVAQVTTRNNTNGLTVGTKTTDKLSFHGAAPVVQRSGVAQSALTDSTTGTAGTTLAAGVGVYTLQFQHTFIGGTSAVEPVTNYTVGHKFKILSWS